MKRKRNAEAFSVTRKKMQAVKSKGTKPELALRTAMASSGIRGYRCNLRGLPGTPDIAFTKYQLAIFIDSEFWHGFNWKVRKNDFKKNRKFWFRKIEDNINRDKRVVTALRQQGWKTIRFWNHDFQQNPTSCILLIKKRLKQQSTRLFRPNAGATTAPPKIKNTRGIASSKRGGNLGTSYWRKKESRYIDGSESPFHFEIGTFY